jgi:hypothetical protein
MNLSHAKGFGNKRAVRRFGHENYVYEDVCVFFEGYLLQEFFF